MGDNDREHVQSLERGLTVLQAFGEHNPRMNLTEVAKRANLTRATARRFLLTLMKLGLVGSDGKMFWLQPRVLDLGFSYLSSLPWWQIAQPILEETARETRESSNLAVLDGTDIVYVSRAAINRIISSNISVGTRLPAFCTAMGRAILSRLPEQELDGYLAVAELAKFTERTITDSDQLRDILLASQQRGYALVDQELEVSLVGLAVPIMDSFGRPVAAMGVSTRAGAEVKKHLVEACFPILLQNSQQITEKLRFQHFQPTGSVVRLQN